MVAVLILQTMHHVLGLTCSHLHHHACSIGVFEILWSLIVAHDATAEMLAVVHLEENSWDMTAVHDVCEGSSNQVVREKGLLIIFTISH